MTAPLDAATRAAVRAWMQVHHGEYWASTLLAEACAAALDLAAADRDGTIPEEVYEQALAWYPDW